MAGEIIVSTERAAAPTPEAMDGPLNTAATVGAAADIAAADIAAAAERTKAVAASPGAVVNSAVAAEEAARLRHLVAAAAVAAELLAVDSAAADTVVGVGDTPVAAGMAAVADTTSPEAISRRSAENSLATSGSAPAKPNTARRAALPAGGSPSGRRRLFQAAEELEAEPKGSPSGAKARSIPGRFAARLKSCP
jgi:hypothetical protein